MQNSEENTALMALFLHKKPNIDIALTLAKYGADLSIVNSYSKDVFMIICEKYENAKKDPKKIKSQLIMETVKREILQRAAQT